MAFSVDNPGFALDVSEDVDVHRSDSGVLQSSGNSSAPLSGESTRRSCPRCHGRMSSFFRDRHTFCTKCRGSDCSSDSRCDECMSWYSEEMEAYVKLRKSLASKGRGHKSMSKTPSSPGSITPSVDVDFDDKIASFSKNVDDRISALSKGLMARFSEMLGQFQLNMSNRSFPAEPEVPGLTPLSGQSPPLRLPVCTDVHPHQFQGTAEGPMLSSSGFVHQSVTGEFTDRSS